jgi:hypothetical protein
MELKMLSTAAAAVIEMGVRWSGFRSGKEEPEAVAVVMQ